MAKTIKLTDRGFELTALCAFRYAVGRHFTQCMGGILSGTGDTVEDVILNNLDHISDNFKCQMLQDIYNEISWYDALKGPEIGGSKEIVGGSGPVTVYTPHYLDHMFNKLREDYKENHGGNEWKTGIQN